MSNVVIDIAAEFTGKKAFKQADTATDKLSKGVKNLGRNLGLALSVGAVLSFAKASVKAAADDEKAQKNLALALTNVGLARDVAATEKFIGALESEFGVVDDKLRPAYQSLAIATQDTAQSQKLLQIALDVSAANSLDLEAVSKALSRAYLGNNTALGKLNVGISKADLKAKSFDEIMNDLATTFKGAATSNAKTFSGQMAKLSVSISNAQEIIGKGLIDSLMILTESESIDGLQTKIVDFAKVAADSFKSLATFLKENETVLKSIAKILVVTFVSTKLILGIAAVIKAIQAITAAMKVLRATSIGASIAQMAVLNPFAAAAYAAALVGIIAATVKGVDALTEKYKDLNVAMENATALAHLAELESRYAAQTLKTKTKLTAEELKALKAKRLQQAIDKANLALGKGQDVFDMEKIQNAAALANQAQLLGRSTTETQRLQIANDVARLTVKQSIANLEDAIAAKDEAAIIAATNKLNADLKVLGALTMQNIKLADIESILKGLKPAELIDQKNLDQALAKIAEMLRLLGMANAASKATVPTSGSLGSGIPSGDFIKPISTEGGSIGAILEYADAATARANAFADLLDMQNIADQLALDEYLKKLSVASSASSVDASSTVPVATAAAIQSGNRYAAQAAAQYNITNNFGVVGDPNSAAEVINNLIREAQDRGTLVAL
jgi:hypothetical protein